MIKFGTDGWRDIIADGFSFSNVRIVTQAICDYLKSEYSGSPRSKVQSPKSSVGKAEKIKLVVGYDTRFLSNMFAREVAKVALANGIEVFLTKDFAPTPAVSFSVTQKRTAGAIVITASHNPPQYNGLKFKASSGSSATSEVIEKIEERLKKNASSAKKPSTISWEEVLKSEDFYIFDPKDSYLSFLLEFLNVGLIKESKIKVYVDPMYGSSQGYLREALEKLGLEVAEIHDEINPIFGKTNPEPIFENLKNLRQEILDKNFDVGLALDGDGDRIAAIDSSGAFVDSHQIFALLLKHLVEIWGWRGDVVKTISTSQMIDLLAQKYGLTLYEVPIGFKNICEHILSKDKDVLIGGEESGGIGIRNHIPERDGILIGLLLVEIMATHRKTLGQLVEDLAEDIGPFYYGRSDIELGEETRGSKGTERILNYLKEFFPKSLNGTSVSKVGDADGYKYYLEDGSWLMIRPSGTERVVRIYAEASTKNKLENLLKEGRNILSKIRKSNSVIK